MYVAARNLLFFLELMQNQVLARSWLSLIPTPFLSVLRMRLLNILHFIYSPQDAYMCDLLTTSLPSPSSTLCDKYLQLLFTVLEKSPEPTIRANTIIAAGDLTFRYPNLIEPWTPYLYAR